jgi:hypothetical protein
MDELNKPSASEGKFVEIEGVKYEADLNNPTEALKDEKGNLVPLKQEEAIDYKAELEKEKVRLEKAEHVIMDLKGQGKELKDIEKETGISLGDIQAIIQESTKKAVKDLGVSLTKGKAEEFAKKTIDDENELSLTMFHYEHSIVHTGNIEDDITKARAIANSKKIGKQISEAQRALLNRTETSSPTGPGQKPPIKSQEPQFSKENLMVMQRYNLRWDNDKKAFIDKNGRIYRPGAPKPEKATR